MVASAFVAVGVASAFDRESPDNIVAAARAEAAAIAGVKPAATRLAEGFRPDRLNLPRCSSELGARGRPTAGQQTRLALEISCSTPFWRVFVPVVVAGTYRVIVLARDVTAGSTLGHQDLTYSEIAVTPPIGWFQSEHDLLGAKLLRTASAGQVILPGWVRRVPAVRRGHPVTLIGRTASVTVRTSGIAVTDAAIAERVRIRNPSSGREIEGIVSGVDSVEIGLD
ncbi:MAG: flagellar basal body P-ring formation chaperone FlgA [Steroidobacteraceae bacterium]